MTFAVACGFENLTERLAIGALTLLLPRNPCRRVSRTPSRGVEDRPLLHGFFVLVREHDPRMRFAYPSRQAISCSTDR